MVFQVFPPERNLLWDSLLCFGHHNTPRSLIKVNFRTVTTERFQKILPKYGEYIFNVHWPNSLGLIEGFCMVCEQPWMDLNPQPFTLKATTLTTVPLYGLVNRMSEHNMVSEVQL